MCHELQFTNANKECYCICVRKKSDCLVAVSRPSTWIKLGDCFSSAGRESFSASMYCQYLWESLWSQMNRNTGKQKGKKMYPSRRSSCFQVISINKNLMLAHYHFPFQHRFASSRFQSAHLRTWAARRKVSLGNC